MTDFYLCEATQWLLVTVALILALSFVYDVVLPSIAVGDVSALHRKYNKSGNAWAVVTGTTSGIGYAFTSALAKAGFNVLMISRNEERLKQTKSEIAALAPKTCKIDYIAADLGTRSATWVDQVGKFVAANEVSILVNNAGFNTEFPKLFFDNTIEEIDSILDVNARSVCVLTHLVVGSMVHRRNGVVINMSSLFGKLSGALVSVYSGTKSFVDSFSASLSEELRGTGVKVFVSLPGFVISNMSKLKRTSLTVISAESCVRTVLKQVSCGSLNTACPHWTHSAIFWLLGRVMPCSITRRIIGSINRGTNKAVVRKLAKSKM